MSLNALLDLELDPFNEITDEVLQEGFCSKARTLTGDSNQNKSIDMEQDTGAACELLLTDYLLNFGEETSNGEECYGGGFSSGVECGSDNEDCSLASLKKSLKKTKKDCSETGKFSRGSGKNDERGKGDDSSVCVKNDTEINKDSSKPKMSDEKKEKERVRSVNYRIQRTQKIKRLEKESLELKGSNKLLSDKNLALNERISALEGQVEYLESVIANESALSTILNTLTEHSGLEFQRNSLRLNSLKRKRQDCDDIQDENAAVKKSNHSKNGGVCLHIATGRVSLEFCRECHKNSTRDEDD